MGRAQMYLHPGVSVPSRGYFFPIKRTVFNIKHSYQVSVPSRGYFFPIAKIASDSIYKLGFRPLSGLFFSDKNGFENGRKRILNVSVPSRGYFFPILILGRE